MVDTDYYLWGGQGSTPNRDSERVFFSLPLYPDWLWGPESYEYPRGKVAGAWS
jgi:hypothetical protein